MKKKLSFLSKLGVSAAALALVGGGLAWAGASLKSTTSGKTKVWVVPEEALTTGQVYTFIGFDGDNGRKQLDNDGNVVDYSLSATDRSFSVSASTNENAILLQALKDDGTESGKYLKYDAKVVANEDKPEIQWQTSFTSATQQSLVNVSNNQRFYFDTNAHKFQTTTDEGAHFAAYVQKEIDNTKITLDQSTITSGAEGNFYKEEGTDATSYFRVGAGVTTPQIKITAPDAGDNVKTILLYAVTASQDVPGSTDWKKAEETASSGEHTKTLSLDDDELFTAGTVQYLHTRIAVYDGDNQLSETKDVLLKLERVNLDKPTIPTGVTRDESNSYTITATATNKTSIVAAEEEDDLATASSASVSGTKNSLESFAKTVYAKTTATPFYDIEHADVTVAPYYTETEAKGMFNITVTEPTNVKAVSGSKIKVKCEKSTATKYNAYTFSISNNNKTTGWSVTVAGSSTSIPVTSVSIDDNDNKVYIITVPEGVQADKAFTLNIPEKAWYGVSSATSVNQVFNNSATASFNSLYAGRTFTMNPGFNNISDKDNAEFSFNIAGPVTGKKTLVLKKGDNTTTVTSSDEIAKQLNVTKGDGETKVSGWTISYNGSNTEPYKITFDNHLDAGDYLITFPAGTLVDEDKKYTNQYNTTAHIYVKEYVNFKFELTDANGNLVSDVCENDNCYIKVTTSTTSGEAPTFTYNGETHASGYRLPRSKYGETSDITVPSDYSSSTSYQPTFTAKQFYANYNYNDEKKTENTAKVWRHVIITSKGYVDRDVNASNVSFYIGAKHKSDEDYLESSEFSLALKDAGVTVKIDGKDANLKVDKDGNATLTLPTGEDKLVAGSYTVSYTYKSKTDGATEFGDPCSSHTVEQTINLINPEYTFVAASTICSNMTSFTFTPNVNIHGPQASAGSATDLSVDEVMSDGTVIENVGTLDKTKNKITLINAPTAGTHKYKIPAGAYTNGVSSNTGSETVVLTVTQHGEYTIIENAENPVKVEHNATATSVKFHMTLTPGSDPVFSDMNKVALVDGSTTVHPTSVELHEPSSVEGTYEFIATFAHEFVPNNYNISIAKDGIRATGVDANDVVLNIPIIVYKAVPTFTATAASQTIVKNASAQNVTLALTATDEENVVRTSEINEDLTKWEILPPNATASTTITEGLSGSAGSYTLNYKFNQVGTYTVTAPDGTFTVDASTNIDDLTWTIIVEPAASWVTTELLKDVNLNDTTLTIPMSELQTEIDLNTYFHVIAPGSDNETTIALNENGSEIAKFKLIAKPSSGSPVAKNTVYDDGEGNLVFTFAAIDPDVCTSGAKITFAANSVWAGQTYQKNATAIVCNFNLTKNFEFNDRYNDVTTTAEQVNKAVKSTYDGSTDTDDSRTMDKLTYKRPAVASGKYQAICVPFQFTEAQAEAAGFKIVKLIAARGTGSELSFYFQTCTSGTDIAYANKPYMIKPTDTSVDYINLELTNVALHTAVPGTATASTTTTSYTFTGTKADKANDGTPKFYGIDSYGYLTNTVAGVHAWRWYMNSTSNGEHYARIFIDGEEVDGEATGINEIISSGALDNAPVYNVAGQRMNGMKSGVNIVNGKKIFKQ